jgi:hypothetical protein
MCESNGYSMGRRLGVIMMYAAYLISLRPEQSSSIQYTTPCREQQLPARRPFNHLIRRRHLIAWLMFLQYGASGVLI